MKKLTIIPYVIIGGVLGFGIHAVRHSLSGVGLFTSGPHITEGTQFILAGMVIGGILHLMISKK
jgi:hypothetical protein